MMPKTFQIHTWPEIPNMDPPQSFDLIEVAFREQIPVEDQHYWVKIKTIVSKCRFQVIKPSVNEPVHETNLATQVSETNASGDSRGHLTLEKSETWIAESGDYGYHLDKVKMEKYITRAPYKLIQVMRIYVLEINEQWGLSRLLEWHALFDGDGY
jgi:hypothetical protein